MSVAIRTPLPPPPPDLYRIPVDLYERLVARGGFGEDDPIELLDGVLVPKMPKSPQHSKSLLRCRRHLEELLPSDAFHVRFEMPIRIPEYSEPEPDISIVRGDDERFTNRNPGPDDAVLIVEVAETSLTRDRGEKRDLYARAGIPTYWIVNLVDRRVEVFEKPENGAYTVTTVVPETGSLSLAVDGGAWGRVDVAAILP
jgi:Uma2 family endonuclease